MHWLVIGCLSCVEGLHPLLPWQVGERREAAGESCIESKRLSVNDWNNISQRTAVLAVLAIDIKSLHDGLTVACENVDPFANAPPARFPWPRL